MHFDSCATRAPWYIKFSVAWSLSACWFCWNICWSIEGAAWWAISKMSQFGNVAADSVLEEVLCDWKLKLHHAVQIRFGHCAHCQFGELFTCLPEVYGTYGYEPQTTSSPPASIYFSSDTKILPFKHKEKEPYISTRNTEKSRAGRNERTAYSCIISALHMILSLLISVSFGKSRNQS